MMFKQIYLKHIKLMLCKRYYCTWTSGSAPPAAPAPSARRAWGIPMITYNRNNNNNNNSNNSNSNNNTNSNDNSNNSNNNNTYTYITN